MASLLEDTNVKMGVLHAVYGVGAMCAPLVSTQFARLPRWSFVYLVHVGLILVNAVVAIIVFRFKNQDGASRAHWQLTMVKPVVSRVFG